MELFVVIGILLVLASALMPIAASIRYKAKKSQCASNLQQLHAALSMYSVDNGRDIEIYPTYLTNLCTMNEGSGQINPSYIDDERIFICPMDDTKATQNIYGVASLKPIYSVSPPVPQDDKHDWAERYSYGYGMRNSSYLYEFSGRICETYDSTQLDAPSVPPDPSDTEWAWYDDTIAWSGSPSNFCDTYLQTKHYYSVTQGPGYEWDAPTPTEVVQNGVGMPDGTIGVTWQDAKFFQLMHGDIYRSGLEDSTFGDFPDPPAGFQDPVDYYSSVGIDPLSDPTDCLESYPRTWMPIIRCFWHQTPMHIDSESYEQVQNMSLAGNVFDSAPYWERTAFKYGSHLGGDSDPVTLGP